VPDKIMSCLVGSTKASHDVPPPVGPGTQLAIQADGRGVVTAEFRSSNGLNTLDDECLRRFGNLLERCERDGARVLCLRAIGKAFCAGADLRSLSAPAPSGVPTPSLPDVLARLQALAIPTIALVQGACVGGGVALAACCDAVLASSTATFAIPEVRLGIPPLALLPFLGPALGWRVLRRYAMSGERFGALDALRFGLVHQLCDGDVVVAAAPIIDAFLKGAPGALAALKGAISRAQWQADGLEDGASPPEADMQILTSAEAREGIAAYLEKRLAAWCPAP
jgi:methylglutaconyl-CoA hydratase